MSYSGLKTAAEAGPSLLEGATKKLKDIAGVSVKAAADGGKALKTYVERCDQALDGKTVGGYEVKPLVGVGLKVTAGAAVTLGVANVVLPAVGFTAAGVGAKTAAAAWQSSIGNVAGGSWFASLQSAGVVGYATTTKVAVASAGGLGGYFSEAFKNLKYKKE